MLVEAEKYDQASKLKWQVEILTQIEKKNNDKKEAVINEEFELAAQIKKQITELESQLQSRETLNSLLNENSTLTIWEEIEKLLSQSLFGFDDIFIRPFL